jgi:hypothetical protein
MKGINFSLPDVIFFIRGFIGAIADLIKQAVTGKIFWNTDQGHTGP